MWLKSSSEGGHHIQLEWLRSAVYASVKLAQIFKTVWMLMASLVLNFTPYF